MGCLSCSTLEYIPLVFFINFLALFTRYKKSGIKPHKTEVVAFEIRK